MESTLGIEQEPKPPAEIIRSTAERSAESAGGILGLDLENRNHGGSGSYRRT